jgi:MarR family transcriptional regulator for hemolysin
MPERRGPATDASHASLGRSLGYQVNVAARATRALLDARLAEQGVTFATWVVLVALSTRGDLIQRDLAGIVDVEGPTMVRRLDQLEAAGLVARSAAPGDRRATRVSLTEAGRALYERLRDAVEEAEVELLREVDPADVGTTQRVLRQIIDRARALRQR